MISCFFVSSAWYNLKSLALVKSMSQIPPVEANHKLSLVIPVYNEGKRLLSSIPEIIRCIYALTSKYNVELWLIDDGSKDDTWVTVQQLSKEYAALNGLRFTRNFGKEAAIMAGLTAATGQAVVVLDSDLQHPPELIPQMVSLWESGFKIVSTCKVNGDPRSTIYRFFSAWFYRLLQLLSNLDLRGDCDFKLLDRTVIQQLLMLPEKNRFFRGLVSWMGYPSVVINFEVPPRHNGESRWSFIRLTRYAIDNITSFSAWPLLIIAWIGFGTTLFGTLIALVALTQKLFGLAETGFTTVIGLVVLLGGMNLISAGIIGYYLARVFDELKGRPLYITYETIPNGSDTRKKESPC